MDSVRFKSTNSGMRDVIAGGSMVIPSGTFPAILERSIDTKIDSAWAKGPLTSGNWVLVSSNYVLDSAFYWYTNQSLQPYAHALYDDTGLHDVNYFKELVTGISDVAPAQSWSVYPNPVVNTLQINSDGSFHGTYELKVLNSLGQLVVNGTTSQNQLDVSFLKSGNYLLNLTDASGKTITLRFSKN